MRTILGCGFGHLPVDFRHINTTHVNNCIKGSTSVSTIDLMSVINITVFLGNCWFCQLLWCFDSSDVGGVRKYDCPEVKLSKSVCQRKKLVKFVNVRNPLSPTKKLNAAQLSKTRHNDITVEKQISAKIKP